MLRAATRPPSTGPTAVPVSDAPVRNPKLVLCTWRGMLAPAAVKAAVIATPTPTPTARMPAISAHAAFVIANTASPAAATTIAVAMTRRAVARARALAAIWCPSAPAIDSSENRTPTSTAALV